MRWGGGAGAYVVGLVRVLATGGALIYHLDRGESPIILIGDDAAKTGAIGFPVSS